MAVPKRPSSRRKSTRYVSHRVDKRTQKRNTQPMTKLERRNASDPLDKSTFADLFGPGYLGEREEGEKQISAPSLPPQPQQKRRMDIPASSDPLEKTCIERDPIPDGYIFVRKGDVYITRHCRSKTKDSKRIVYLVYDNKGKRTIGIRVPKDIYHSVRSDSIATADSRADAVKVRDKRDLARSRELLLSQFPQMPPSSLEKILEHAFLKGSGRVGRSTTRSDERKAELAVEAHIRHLHTQYDELLDSGLERDQARDMVWDAVQDVKAAWGGKRRESPLPTKRTKRKKRIKTSRVKVTKKAKK